MLRTEHMITRIRQETDNEKLGTDQGINDNEIIAYINDAQADIYGGIANVFRSAFAKEYTFSATSGQEDYSVPSDAYMDGQAIVLEYSQSGQLDGYKPLKRVTMRERTTISGIPCRYTVANGLIFTWPVPQATQGSFRLVYSKVVPKVDKIRARVATVTQIGQNITALTLLAANGSAFTSADEQDFLNNDFLSVSDFYGNTLCRGVPYSAVTLVAGVGVVTIVNSSHTLETGESITIGDYVTLGKDSTSVSQLPDNCEPYLIAYASMKVFIRDNNNLAGIKSQEVGAMRANLLDNYAELSADVDSVPNISRNDDDWWV
jgi:hypothetical protein